MKELAPELHVQIRSLSKRLLASDSAVFSEIDAFFAALYGLDDLDLEVIQDTLDVCLPYSSSRHKAWASPTTAQRLSFCQRLASILKPFCKAIGKEPRIDCWAPTGELSAISTPFLGVQISDASRAKPAIDDHIESLIMRLGEETGASRIVELIDGGMVVFMLNQYRYWTPSRARLLATEILRRHFSIFEG